MKAFEITEAHGNSKIYDKCWKGYRKVKGKKRGEKGSCVKEGIFDFFGSDEPEVNEKGFPYYTGDEEKDLPVVVYILKAYKGDEAKTLKYLTKELKHPHVRASLYVIRAQTPGVSDDYPAFKLKKPEVKETATAGGTSAGAIASVANPLTAHSKPKKKGKYGAPKAPQATNKDGTAKNALDLSNNLMGGKTIRR